MLFDTDPGSKAPVTGDITTSLRLRNSPVGYASHTNATPTNRTTWTFSCWIKVSNLTGGVLGKAILESILPTVSGDVLQLQSTNTLGLNLGGSVVATSTLVLRDPSAFYHVLLNCNGSSISAYLNGTLAFTYAGVGSYINLATSVASIGASFGTLRTIQMARACFLDGQCKFTSDFTFVSSVTGELTSHPFNIIKGLADLAGNNSFMLEFLNDFNFPGTLTDSSSHGNNFITTNISAALDYTYDLMKDAPGNSCATLNGLYTGASTLTNGNLTASGTTDLPTLMPSSGTYYFEISGVPKTWTPPAAFPSAAGNYNFGQQPFFNTPTAQTLCQKNLPAAAIPLAASHFRILLDTGANILATCTAVFGLAKILNWIKDRANVNNNQLIDSRRGASTALFSNTTTVEAAYTAPAGSSVGWLWNMGDADVVNSDGTINSVVNANTVAGQSVVTYTGTGANGTVGHGLNSAPELVIVKTRSTAALAWIVYHSGLTSALYYLVLNTTVAQTSSAAVWNSTAPNALNFSVGNNASVNTAASLFVAYCFHSVEGYSKVGTYVGNAAFDGTFVYCGFKPAFLLVKNRDGADDWRIYDSSRSPYNTIDLRLCPNLTNAEAAVSGVDFTATGFKLRTSGVPNTAATWVFYAVAEVPSNFANAF